MSTKQRQQLGTTPDTLAAAPAPGDAPSAAPAPGHAPSAAPASGHAPSAAPAPGDVPPGGSTLGSGAAARRPAPTDTTLANDGKVMLDGVPPIPVRIVERLTPYQNVRGATLQGWTADGTGIYITTRFADVEQLHEVAMPGGARRQLTFFREPVNGAWRRPGASDLVFVMDEGGSEFFQLFALDPRTGEHRRLTDGRSRNTFGEWSRDGHRLAFSSTKRNGRATDVYVMDASDTSSARIVHEAPDGAWWTAADWGPDGRRLLVVQYVSIVDSRVHVLDLETGVPRLVAGGGERTASYGSVEPAFAADGAGIFLVTDEESDYKQLAYLDPTNGKLQVLTGDLRWDVEALELSEDRTRGAFVVNEGGLSRLYLLNPGARTYRPVEGVPPGVILNLRFSPDGRRLGFSLNSAVSPSDVYVVDVGGPDGEAPLVAGQPVRWTYSEVGGLDTKSFVEPELVSYPTFDLAKSRTAAKQPGPGSGARSSDARRRIPAFLYRPRTPGPHPVVIYIHGGPEAQFRPGFSSLLQFWVTQLGAAVVAPNVRGSSGYGKSYVELDDGLRREDSVKDIGALLDWIATRPDLDAKRLAVYGGSYGGYMVLATLVHYGERLRAGVDIVGISNFVTFLENTQDYRRDLRRVEYGDERDPEMREFLERISPNRRAARITTPLFVAQGANDPRVPLSEAEQIVHDVRANGRDVWYMVALNEGHGFQKKENRDLFEQAVALFFEAHLLKKKDEAPPSS